MATNEFTMQQDLTLCDEIREPKAKNLLAVGNWRVRLYGGRFRCGGALSCGGRKLTTVAGDC